MEAEAEEIPREQEALARGAAAEPLPPSIPSLGEPAETPEKLLDHSSAQWKSAGESAHDLPKKTTMMMMMMKKKKDEDGTIAMEMMKESNPSPPASSLSSAPKGSGARIETGSLPAKETEGGGGGGGGGGSLKKLGRLPGYGIGVAGGEKGASIPIPTEGNLPKNVIMFNDSDDDDAEYAFENEKKKKKKKKEKMTTTTKKKKKKIRKDAEFAQKKSSSAALRGGSEAFSSMAGGFEGEEDDARRGKNGHEDGSERQKERKYAWPFSRSEPKKVPRSSSNATTYGMIHGGGGEGKHGDGMAMRSQSNHNDDDDDDDDDDDNDDDDDDDDDDTLMCDQGSMRNVVDGTDTTYVSDTTTSTYGMIHGGGGEAKLGDSMAMHARSNRGDAAAAALMSDQGSKRNGDGMPMHAAQGWRWHGDAAMYAQDPKHNGMSCSGDDAHSRLHVTVDDAGSKQNIYAESKQNIYAESKQNIYAESEQSIYAESKQNIYAESTQNIYGSAHENLSEENHGGIQPEFVGARTSGASPSIKPRSRPYASDSYYRPLSVTQEKLQVGLRLGGMVFSAIAFSVMFSTSETRVASGSTFQVKFSDFQAYNYLVALNMLCFLYSSGQLIIFVRPKSSVLTYRIRGAAMVYICDQVLAFLLVSSSSSAATASGLSHYGLRDIWPPACSTWNLWILCSKADSAIAMAFLSSFLVTLSSFLSGYHFSVLLAE